MMDGYKARRLANVLIPLIILIGITFGGIGVTGSLFGVWLLSVQFSQNIRGGTLYAALLYSGLIYWLYMGFKMPFDEAEADKQAGPEE